MDSDLPRREASRARTREAIIDAADRLFREVGFDDATVEAIADIAGISRRTFFRYFVAKEELLFLDWRDDLEAMVAALAEVPADVPIDRALRDALLVVADRFTDEQKERIFRTSVIVLQSATAGQYSYSVSQPEWERRLAIAIGARLGLEPASVRAMLWSSVTIGVMTAALGQWLSSGAPGSLHEVIESVFDVLRNDLAQPL